MVYGARLFCNCAARLVYFLCFRLSGTANDLSSLGEQMEVHRREHWRERGGELK